MSKQSLTECILKAITDYDDLFQDLSVPTKRELANFISGWLKNAIETETVDLELDKKGK